MFMLEDAMLIWVWRSDDSASSRWMFSDERSGAEGAVGVVGAWHQSLCVIRATSERIVHGGGAMALLHEFAS